MTRYSEEDDDDDLDYVEPNMVLEYEGVRHKPVRYLSINSEEPRRRDFILAECEYYFDGFCSTWFPLTQIGFDKAVSNWKDFWHTGALASVSPETKDKPITCLWCVVKSIKT
jgi:hypothetical protein